MAEITIEGIAARARVPVGSVYQYFSSKVALLAAVAEAVMDETDAESARQLAETRALPWREAVDRVVEATPSASCARPPTTEPPDFDELVEETERLAKGYLGTYVG